jgi:hypothetical protein
VRRRLLLALSIFGLVLAPVLHAELHARESEAEQEMARLLQRVAKHGPDFDQAFAQLWKLGHQKQAPHSHGPARGQPHGSNSLQHFAVAMHPAPPPPSIDFKLLTASILTLAPPSVIAQPWRIPERSQAPPQS